MRPERSKAWNLVLRVFAVCALVLAGWSRMAASAQILNQGFEGGDGLRKEDGGIFVTGSGQNT